MQSYINNSLLAIFAEDKIRPGRPRASKTPVGCISAFNILSIYR